jgi:transcriptional regulator with XRE-family HTH domain
MEPLRQSVVVETFPELLHLGLSFHGHCQRDAAEELGISIRTVLRWLSGRRKPPRNYHARVASYLGIEVDSLVDLLERGWRGKGRRGKPRSGSKQKRQSEVDIRSLAASARPKKSAAG